MTLGGITASMCRGLAQEGLVGKDFLWPYKCVFNTGTVHTKDTGLARGCLGISIKCAGSQLLKPAYLLIWLLKYLVRFTRLMA